MSTVFDVVTAKIVEQLDAGVVPWQKPWVTGMPRSIVTGNDYRGFNAFILGMSGTEHSTPFWTTFNQAKELGGMVRKGEKSTPIAFWKSFDKDEKNPSADRAEPGEKKDKGGMMCRYYRVFNASQIEWTKGEPKLLEAWRQNLADRGIGAEPVESAEKIVAEMLDAPKIKHGGTSAHYVPALDSIQMPPKETFKTTEGYYSTLFHELTHATGHPTRCGRFELGATPSKETYSKEELVAELGSCFLSQKAGIKPNYEQSAAYIANWSKAIKSEPRLIVSAAAAAQKSTEHVLGISPERARAQEKTPDQEIAPALQATVAIDGDAGKLAGREPSQLIAARGTQQQHER